MEPKPEGSESGTDIFYFVEVRSCIGKPLRLGELLVGENWRRLDLDAIKIKDVRWIIPTTGMSPWADARRMFSYETAMALAWDVIAIAHSVFAYGVEVRLVKVKAVYSFAFTREEEGEPLPWKVPTTLKADPPTPEA